MNQTTTMRTGLLLMAILLLFAGTALASGIYLPPSPFEVGFLSAAHRPEDIGHLDLAGQGPGVRCLDHGTIRDRVAVGNAQLTQAAAMFGQRAQHVAGLMKEGAGLQVLCPGAGPCRAGKRRASTSARPG